MFWTITIVASLVDAMFFGVRHGIITMAIILCFLLVLSLALRLYLLIRFRDEYEACAAAVLADSPEQADFVNTWTRHYYVHKAFYASAGEDGLKCGYRLSISERPSDFMGGAGGGDMMSFGG